MGWQGRLRALGIWAWHNIDAVFVVLVAFGILLLEAVGDPSRELVDSAILATLGVTAIMLLRDRGHRVDLQDLTQLAGDAISDRPYEVVWQENHWDLQDRQLTVVHQTEELRFTRNDVATNFQWSMGDGAVKDTHAKWRRERGKGPWIPAKKVHEFPVRGGTKVIFCFDEEHNRGDSLEWCTERRIVGRFPSAHEGIEIQARTRSDHPRVIRITWPTDAPPSRAEIRHASQPARPLTLRRKDGRLYVEEKIAGMEIGEIVRIDWAW